MHKEGQTGLRTDQRDYNINSFKQTPAFSTKTHVFCYIAQQRGYQAATTLSNIIDNAKTLTVYSNCCILRTKRHLQRVYTALPIKMPSTEFRLYCRFDQGGPAVKSALLTVGKICPGSNDRLYQKR